MTSPIVDNAPPAARPGWIPRTPPGATVELSWLDGLADEHATLVATLQDAKSAAASVPAEQRATVERWRASLPAAALAGDAMPARPDVADPDWARALVGAAVASADRALADVAALVERLVAECAAHPAELAAATDTSGLDALHPDDPGWVRAAALQRFLGDVGTLGAPAGFRDWVPALEALRKYAARRPWAIPATPDHNLAAASAAA